VARVAVLGCATGIGAAVLGEEEAGEPRDLLRNAAYVTGQAFVADSGELLVA
jgi:hypothetical protein